MSHISILLSYDPAAGEKGNQVNPITCPKHLLQGWKRLLTEEEVSLTVVEAQDGQRLAAGSELPVGHVVPGVDQFDQSSLPTSRQNAAVLS